MIVRLLRRHLPGVRDDCRGSTALEFALVGSVFFTIVLGIIATGMVMWSRTTLQTVAVQTARCVAIGASACAGGGAQYAVSLANAWLPNQVLTTGDVAVAATTACFGASGNFASVTITAPVWLGGLIYPIAGGTQTLQACFPVSG